MFTDSTEELYIKSEKNQLTKSKEKSDFVTNDSDVHCQNHGDSNAELNRTDQVLEDFATVGKLSKDVDSNSKKNQNESPDCLRKNSAEQRLRNNHTFDKESMSDDSEAGSLKFDPSFDAETDLTPNRSLTPGAETDLTPNKPLRNVLNRYWSFNEKEKHKLD